jgi:hypothetical protein
MRRYLVEGAGRRAALVFNISPSLCVQFVATLLSSLPHLSVPVELGEWEVTMRSAVKLLSQRDAALVKLVTAVIWAACAYGRLGEASFVEFMVAFRGVLEQGPSVRDRLKGSNHTAVVLRQASRWRC